MSGGLLLLLLIKNLFMARIVQEVDVVSRAGDTFIFAEVYI